MRCSAYAFAFLGGCCVMVIEILGTRVLAPHFGVALFVWTAQIAVTLACLAVGYWAGGKVAQRQTDAPSVRRPCRYIGGFASVAGLWMICLPILARGLLPLLHGADLRIGALVGSILLFALPLCLLACIPPICVSVLATSVTSPGAVAGRIYAVSTAGSFVTTICLGFWLVPWHSISGTIQISGTILLASGVVILLPAAVSICRMTCIQATVLAGGIATVCWTPRPLSGESVVWLANSPHTEIAVLDRDGYRTMLLDRVGHTVFSREDMMPVDPHFYYLNMLTVMRPRAHDALLLGVAGGSVFRVMANHDLQWDAVELDAEVLKTARAWFDLPETPDVRFFTTDGRAFLRTTDRRYDFVVMDAYSSDVMPRHLCSLEAFGAARDAMQPGGVLVINLPGSRTGLNARAWAATWHTLAAVFKHVRAFSPRSRSFSEKLGVVTIFASDAPLDMSGYEISATHLSETALQHLRRMQSCELPEPPMPGVMLTDDRNQIEGWELEVAAEARAAWNRMLDL